MTAYVREEHDSVREELSLRLSTTAEPVDHEQHEL